MIFNSIPFLFLFLPVSLIGFFMLARLGWRLALAWLVLVSLVFYSYWNIAFLPFLLGSIAFNYAVAWLLFGLMERPRLQTGILAFGVTADLGALAYYKYLFALFGFLRVHAIVDVPFAHVALPLGISFFTFTQIAYLIDVRQGTAKDRDLLDYVLFVTFFPHLIAGPILHNREMMPQYSDERNRHFSSENLAVGLAIFMIGIGKKVLIADMLAPRVHWGFDAGLDLSLRTSWQVAMAYTFQLYFDFSGYSDMAIGLARMFNIRFPVNFNSPFKAASIIDYWQRWHMTLTRLVNMYVFTPLSLALTRRWLAAHPGTVKSATRKPAGFLLLTAFPVLFTMILLGIWHGAGLQFLIFGLLHGSYLVVNHAWRTFVPKREHGPFAGAVIHGAKVALTCLVVLIALIFFRAPSIPAALHMLAGLVGMNGWAIRPTDYLPVKSQTWGELELAALYALVWLAPNTQQIMEAFRPVLGKVEGVTKTAAVRWTELMLGHTRGEWLAARVSWKPNYAWAAFAAVIFVASLTQMTGISPFLYFQF